MLDQALIDKIGIGSTIEDILFDESAYLDAVLDEEEEMDDIHITESSDDLILDHLSEG
jgi:hypothetical protein